MANFEALIRGALSSQEASDPQVRAKIYQSSRNALHRMITENRAVTVEAAIEQQQSLENAISNIEAEFNAPPPPPVVETPPAPDPQPEFVAPTEPEFVETPPQPVQSEADRVELHPPQAPELPSELPPEMPPQPQMQETVEPIAGVEPPREDPLAELQAILESDNAMAPQPEVPTQQAPGQIQPEPVAVAPHQHAVDPAAVHVEENYYQEDEFEEYYQEERQPPLGFAKRRKSQRRFTGLLIFLLIFGLLAYLGYQLYVNFVESGLLSDNNGSQNQNILSRQNDRDEFITILEASDPSSLIVANRGSAEIITQQNSQMIRLFSTRTAENRENTAKPILLRIPSGALEQISNKQITVEIFAKSGTSSPAQFRVECQFEGAGQCTPKRFRIGLQPEASVFGATIGNISNPDSSLFLAINTDTTSSAAVTGNGDVIDIAYVRIRAN